MIRNPELAAAVEKLRVTVNEVNSEILRASICADKTTDPNLDYADFVQVRWTGPLEHWQWIESQIVDSTLSNVIPFAGAN